tara:strand:+ start:34 stop:426 length:393 start_codon:yes stop_codon:yes gene_type:complete
MLTMPLRLARIIVGHFNKGRFNAIKQIGEFMGFKNPGQIAFAAKQYTKNAHLKGIKATPIYGRKARVISKNAGIGGRLKPQYTKEFRQYRDNISEPIGDRGSRSLMTEMLEDKSITKQIFPKGVMKERLK